MEYDNETDIYMVERNITQDELVYLNVKYYSYGVLLPIIFLFGVVGNILNIVIFTRSRYRHTLDDIEKSATAGLIALAISDLLFCCIALPEPFISSGTNGSDNILQIMAFYYKTYKIPLMNVFLFSSTWLIVAISSERFIAVCFPFQARWFIQLNRTISIDIAIYVLSVLFNLPGFLKYEVHSIKCPDGSTLFIHLMRSFYAKHSFREGYQIAWTLFGAFIPLVFLTLCNIRLLVEVYRSRARYATERHKYTTSRVTIILVAIILMYLFMVCPSMLLGFFGHVLPHRGPEYYYRYQIAIIITNVTQGINFAINFILYCAVSKAFRDNLKIHMCWSNNSSMRTSNVESNRYHLVDVNTDTKVTKVNNVKKEAAQG